MKSLKRALGLGLLVWLVPFVVAVLVFPFREPWRALFESVMAVAVSFTAVAFGLAYLKKIPSPNTRDGLLVGLLWWAICVAIDLPLFSAGPMEMALTEYMADIGLTYLAIPLITSGLGFACGAGASSARPAGGSG